MPCGQVICCETMETIGTWKQWGRLCFYAFCSLAQGNGVVKNVHNFMLVAEYLNRHSTIYWTALVKFASLVFCEELNGAGKGAKDAKVFLLLFPDRGNRSGKEPCPAGKLSVEVVYHGFLGRSLLLKFLWVKPLNGNVRTAAPVKWFFDPGETKENTWFHWIKI